MTMQDQARQWLALIEAAARDFKFREPPPVSTVDEAGAYLHELIGHVESRDLARGFELRVGCKQADWTPDMVDAFAKSMMGRPRRDPDRFTKPFSVYEVALVTMPAPVDDAALRLVVDATLQSMIDLRVQGPAAELPLLVGGLLTTGELITTTVDRDDRIAFVTAMARNKPLYGWFVASDMFIHAINTGDTKSASKQDAIGIHFGTRTVRGFLVQPYNIRGGAVHLLPRREDFFQVAGKVEDPYAFIFAPPTSGVPS